MLPLVFVKKGMACLIILVFTLGVLVGCTNNKGAIKNPSFNEIVDNIKKVVDLSTLKEGNYARLKRSYGIAREDIEEFVLYRAPSNIKADEILLIKVKQPEAVSKVKEQVEQRVAKQAASFKDYLPEEYYLIEKRVVKVQGSYILLVISQDAEQIAQAFEECF